MNALTPQKLMELQAATQLEIRPVLAEETRFENFIKLPVSDFAAMGLAFQPLAELASMLSGEAGSGMYWVSVPEGMHLAAYKDGKGYLGGYLNANNQLGGQSVLTPMIDPTMLFMAALLMNIDHKLSCIQEMQVEILDFMNQKERAELRADLQFLNDILMNYQYNWDDSQYKSANYVKVLDIRQEAGRKIDFCRTQIVSGLEKRQLFHGDKKAQKQLDNVGEQFERYQMALYIYAFSYYLEVMLQENYDAQYLSGITNKIDEYSLDYRELYSLCYERVEGYLHSSVQENLRRGLSAATKATGESIAKMPIISKTPIDEALISAGEKMTAANESRVMKRMEKFVDKQGSYIRPFVDSIEMISRLHNQPIHMLVDGEYAYIGTESE